MLKDVQNSIKAKLYDFTYSPFMSSMIISWIIINHKYILIYMASYDLDKKLSLLNKYDFAWDTTWFHVPWAFNIWLPILFGLFYTFVYPMASKKFYEFTLEKNKELKKIKQDVEDVTPITQEEARTLRESITQLTETKYELEKKVIESEDRYKKKVEESEKNSLNNHVFTYGDTGKYGDKGKAKIISTKVNIKEDDRTKILRYLYESNYKPEVRNDLLDNLVKKTNIPRPKSEKVLDFLLKEKILYEEPHEHTWKRYISITSEGNNILLEMFDKEK